MATTSILYGVYSTDRCLFKHACKKYFMEMHDPSRILLEEALEAHPKGTRRRAVVVARWVPLRQSQ